MTTDFSRLTCREGREGVREGGKKGEREEGNHQKYVCSSRFSLVLFIKIQLWCRAALCDLQQITGVPSLSLLRHNDLGEMSVIVTVTYGS